MLWGGLQPIASRVVFDLITLSSLTYCAVDSSQSTINGLLLIATVAFHWVTTADWTNRWTISLPMIPFALLQLLRRMSTTWGDSTIISFFSLSFIVMSAALCVLFPALQLPPIKGKYNVGIVDIFLPVNFDDEHESNGFHNGSQRSCDSIANGHSHSFKTIEQSFVTARILYPTLEKPSWIPLINPSLAKEFLKQSMRFGAPSFLRDFGWMLHTWRLTKIPVRRNATLATKESLNGGELQQHPMVVFSHGLGGNYNVYSYQTMMLAASGAVVLALDHSDGSASVMEKHDGTRVSLDFSVSQMWYDGKKEEYVRVRRALTNMRVQEFLAATDAFIHLNQRNIPELASVGVSFVNHLDPSQLHFAGHSFGGATALAAGKRRTNLPRSILAHDPAIDWLPDDARRSLFDPQRLSGSALKYEGGTGGYETDQTINGTSNSSSSENSSIHNVEMFFLYSENCYKVGWGESHLVEDMKKRCVLGPKDGKSEFGIVAEAQHNEFSDTCALTPIWLARLVGVTGKRNPLDTAEEIAVRTRDFLESLN